MKVREMNEMNNLPQIEGEELPRISLAGCEIVRRQFLSHMKEITVTIKPDGLIFNMFCLSKLENTVFIHMMVDRGKHWFIIRSCDEDDKDGQRWCNVKDDGVRKTRKITGKDFGTRLYHLMKWTQGYFYKVCGSLALQDNGNNELLIVFELDDAEKYPMTSKSRLSAGVDDSEIDKDDLAKLEEIEKRQNEEKAARKAAKERGEIPAKSKRKSKFPDVWEQDSFGTLFAQHTNRIRVPSLQEDQLDMFSTLPTEEEESDSKKEV